MTFQSRSKVMAALAAALLASLPSAAGAGADPHPAGAAEPRPAGPLEAAVKADYLYKFAPFVTWPAAAFPSMTSPFNICLVGQDPFGPILDNMMQGRTVGDHPIAVRRLAAPEERTGCHMLFVGPSPTYSTAEMLQSAAGAPVLTVTDHDHGGAGGMIDFILQDGRVRFSIDAANAESGGLQISSKLLDLAVSVRRPVK